LIKLSNQIIKQPSKMTTPEELEMDQFMNDFMNGKLDDGDKPHKIAPKRGVRRTKSGDDSKLSAGRRGSHTSEEGASSRRRGSHTSEDGHGHRHHHHGHKRAQRRSTTSKDKIQLDPQTMLRMLEGYADANHNDTAEAMLHYFKGGHMKNKLKDEKPTMLRHLLAE